MLCRGCNIRTCMYLICLILDWQLNDSVTCSIPAPIISFSEFYVAANMATGHDKGHVISGVKDYG